MEEWKIITEYGCGDYQISSNGRVKSTKNGKEVFLKPIKMKRKGKDTYLQVVLCEKGVRKSFLIHRLVATYFIPNPKNLPTVNHKDEVKTNNYVDNLEWMTYADNNNYGTHNEKANATKSKRVIGINIVNGYIVEFSSTREAGESGFDQSHVSRCCIGKEEKHKGYRWFYVE